MKDASPKKIFSQNKTKGNGANRSFFVAFWRGSVLLSGYEKRCADMKTFRVTLIVDGKKQLMIIAAKNEKQVEKRVEKFFRNMEYDNGFIDKIERID